jgi:thiamine-monophosphate kinase
MPGEFDLIRWIQSQHKPSDLVLTGPGDDLAVLKWPANELLLVGVDQVLDGVHFDSTLHSPRAIGRKVMNRNLSDCAAMACLPAAAVATVALPRSVDLEYAKELYLGMRDAADPFACEVVGGDTASWEGKLAMTVAILGRSAGVQPVLRSGAKPGDGIYVTGPLGGSILGRHMTFTPRIFEAAVLVRKHPITAMIDLSDGLSRDLRHVCEQSNVGAVIDASSIPIHDDAIMASRQDRRIPLEHALHDGEDHELLFTTAPDANVPHVRIGTVTAEPGIFIDRDGQRAPLEPKGWEHAI